MVKRFFILSCFAATIGVLAVVACLSIRIVLFEPTMREMFSMPEGADTLILGNSHTGYGWIESPAEFKNKVIWSHGTPFLLSLMRLKEMERRGQLVNVRRVLVNLDAANLGFNTQDSLERCFYENGAFAWRYIDLMPIGKCHLALSYLTRIGCDWVICSNRKGWDAAHYKRNGKVLGETRKLSLKNSEVFRTMDSLKKICNRNSCELVFFATPLVRVDNEGDFADELSPILAHAKQIGCAYWDMRRDCDDEYFKDADHLNKKGARYISEKWLK